MISSCSRNTLDNPFSMQECIAPDSLTGMIFAMEGIKNTLVLLNGPMGCKFYHSTTSQFLSLRPMLYLPLPGENGQKVPVDYNYLNDWFFRQPRVPSTALDGYDYVYGTSEKVKEALLYIREHISFDLLAIVNSPGACLIGDNLKELSKQIVPDRNVVMLESPGFSLEFDTGYAESSLELLKQMKHLIADSGGVSECGLGDVSGNDSDDSGGVSGNDSDDPGAGSGNDSGGAPAGTLGASRVNLLGLSIWDRYLEGDRMEWIRLLKLCGIEVNCCLCAENSFAKLLSIAQADLNIVINPDRALETANYLKETYGTDYYVCESLPVGFASTEKIIGDICRKLQKNADTFIRESERARAICFSKINDIYHMCGLPKGATFAIEGNRAQKKSFSEFFTQYLGMLESEKEKADLVFGDANTIAQIKLLDHGQHEFCGIEINLPGMGYTDVLPKTQMGIQGAMFLVEQVLNGLSKI